MLGTESEGAPISYGYGHLFTTPIARAMDRSRRQNGSDAAGASEMVRRLQPGRVLNYAMGLEPWYRHLFPVQYTPETPQLRASQAFLDDCKASGIPAERPYLKGEWRWDT